MRPSRSAEDRRSPPQGWSGGWNRREENCSIDFSPVLRRILNDLDYSAEEVLFSWRERGWLITRSDKKARYTRQVRIDGHQVEVISIAPKAIRRLCAEW